MKPTNIDKLRERIEQNYSDYKADVLEILDGDLIFDLASEIAAVEDVYLLSKTSGWIEEAEAAYLLEFAEPLKMLADAWEDFLFDTDSEFRMIVEDVIDNDDNTESYITVSLADRLRTKYGDDVSIRGALLTEAVEAGEKFLRLQKLLDDEGGDFCFDEE